MSGFLRLPLTYRVARVRSGAIAVCAAVLLSGAAAAPDPVGVPDALRVEYATAPIGLDEAAPRLAWHVPFDRQRAYRSRVAETQAALEAGPLTWDSGRVESDASTQIAYAGPPLRARQEYWWQVQLWDAEGQPSGWSAPARWSC